MKNVFQNLVKQGYGRDLAIFVEDNKIIPVPKDALGYLDDVQRQRIYSFEQLDRLNPEGLETFKNLVFNF